jgi:hypothetical protein
MTEGNEKKCGFVIDMNIHRVIETSMITYASLIKPLDHPRDAVRYILQERIIILNGDDWMTSFGNETSKMNEFSNSIYNIYSSNTEKALQHFIERLHFKNIILSKDEQKMFNTLFCGSNTKLTQKQKEDIQKLLNDDSEKIKKGIERVGEEDSESNSDSEPEPDKKINYMDVLKHIIPLICILTIHDDETSFIEMFHYIELHPDHYQILIDQTRSWWGNSIDSVIIKKFISIYIKYMADDKETNQIIRTIKEIFMKNITNMKELSSLIDKYFIPQELEKKTNAEISTPHKLRQEMLDTIPLEFWTSPKRVFEPCAGKGGFLIDIIDRFMIGLYLTFPDEKIRYKVIVEKCLYFSDINPTNIFICKLLIDPYNEYSLHWNEGNTLELNVQEKWGISLNDVSTIGNPPYSTDPSKPDTKPLYDKFIEKYINCKLLLFVVPSRWFVGGKGLDHFREFMIKRKDIVYIQHEDDATKWFGNKVDIEGGVNYFLKDASYEGLCLFNGVPYNLSKYDCIVKPKYHKLIDIIKNMESINKLYMGRYFGIETNDKRFTDNGKIKCFVSLQKSKDRCKYISTYDFDDKNTFWKVITAEANGKMPNFGFKIIGKPNEVHTGSYISFRVNNEDEAKSLLSYLDTKFANYMLSVRKISQHINGDVCKWIPFVPLDRIWTDDKVCEYLKIEKSIYII